jgi:hypothetical protein
MSDDTFLVPQTVFVGDEGRLVVPLAEMPAGQSNAVITDRLPYNENIIVKRVEIDVRAKQLLIDFVAFRPGVLEIPPIGGIGETNATAASDAIDTTGAIASIELPPLKVEIASILEREGYSIILSPLERPLAAPGTFALVSGGTAALVALAAAVVFLAVKGPKRFHRIFEKVRVRLLILRTKRAIQKTQNALVSGRIGAKEGAAAAGAAFKSFLSAFYRKDYASYAAEDFLSDALFCDDAAYRVFAACDKFKFSPAPVEQDDIKAFIEKTLYCVYGMEERTIEGRVA